MNGIAKTTFSRRRNSAQGLGATNPDRYNSSTFFTDGSVTWSKMAFIFGICWVSFSMHLHNESIAPKIAGNTYPTSLSRSSNLSDCFFLLELLVANHLVLLFTPVAPISLQRFKYAFVSSIFFSGQALDPHGDNRNWNHNQGMSPGYRRSVF